MRFLSPEERVLVNRARALGLAEATPAPAYLSPELCMALSLLLVPSTLGTSLLLVPVLWAMQHDRTARRLAALRRAVERLSGGVAGDGAADDGRHRETADAMATGCR